MRYGLLREIQLQKVNNSMAQKTELSIPNYEIPIYVLSLDFGSFIVGLYSIIRFMRYGLLWEIRPQALDIEFRASY